jgi:hypothetical protein
MELSEARRLKALEDENAKLKKLPHDGAQAFAPTLDNPVTIRIAGQVVRTNRL